MALAKERIPHDSSMSSKVQTCAFNEYQKSVLEEEEASQNINGFSNESAITHSSSLSGNGYVYNGTNSNYHAEEAQSLINFKANGYGFSNLMNASESFLSFQQSKTVSHSNYLKNYAQKEHSMWDNNFHQGYYSQWNQISPRSNTEPRLMQDFNCFQTASNYSSVGSTAKEKQNGESSEGWLYSQSSASADELQNSVAQEAAFNKRPSMGESMQLPAKKQCTNASKLSKVKSIPSKDPQSIAAKNRREKISERLKILQELVPNGSKVDLVTMLEKAISYVKFLQLQVKVLATDEFWPVQGGKAPDIAQVKEAIDAILSSQKDRNSSSK